MGIRLDLHVHSCYSSDSRLEVETILKVARERGLTGVAITDHGTVAGGVAAAEANDDPSFIVIPGAEYATDAGHILALFLDSDLPLAGQGPLPWQEVVAAVHDRGGLAFLAHPFKHRRDLPQGLLAALDGIETFNARACHAGNRRANEEAALLASKLGLAISGGSDAHWAGEIGRGYWEAQEDLEKPSLDRVREMLAHGKGTVKGRPAPLYYETWSQVLKASRLKDYRRLPRIAAKFLLSYARVSVGRRRS